MSNTPDSLETLFDALTEKQRRWVDAYAGQAKGNGTEAARLAGYAGSDAVLACVAYENRRKPQIAAVIEALTESNPLVPNRERRMRNLGMIANGRCIKTIRNPDTGVHADVEMAAEPKDIIAANRELGLLHGDYVTKIAPTNAAGEDLSGMPWADLMAVTAHAKESA